jgi:hypothetical protein
LRSEENIFQLFLARIRAWQDFMRRGTDSTLDPEAEIGLFGELVFLRSILEAGVAPTLAVEGWLGPINGIQDFALGAGAVEVKTTIAASGFHARIASLEQLDDSFRTPLFLAAVRLCQTSLGITLADIVEDARELLENDSEARSSFDIKLIHAGYLDAVSDSYKRRFALAGTQVIRVEDGFPRLIAAVVPRRVMHVRYELNLEGIDTNVVDTREALQQLGVI